MESQLFSVLFQEIQTLRKEVSELKDLLIVQQAPKESESLTSLEVVNGLENQISAFLHDLKISTNLKGYRYLKEAIGMAVCDLGVLNGTTYRLYPIIARKYQTTSSSVERAIRHAIEISYERNYLHSFYSKKYLDKKPTNNQFMAEVVETFRLNGVTK